MSEIKLTDYERACLRRDCIKIVMETGSANDSVKPVDKAKEIFKFVVGESKTKEAPEEQT